MKMTHKRIFTAFLAFVMVMGMTPITPVAQTAATSDLPAAMDGLTIGYPYNTETVQQTGAVSKRFNALTFESARNEVESAQMILTPNFSVNSFSLTMHAVENEKGNIIPADAFEVFVQHYVKVTDSRNAPNYNSSLKMYHPETGTKGTWDGTYPDALIPQDAAIAAGENVVTAGNNQGIWVNLNVGDAAPGTYTGTATLTVNAVDMAIPVSIRIYDVRLPDEVHVKSSVGIWWDQLEFGQGTTMNRELADAYFSYLVSKRVMPLNAWNISRWDNDFAEYAASYLAVAPEISAYAINHERGEDSPLDVDALRTTLTTLINKNISLAQSGSNVDLFKKAYLYIYDEPRNDETYALVNTITAQLDGLKSELAPLLDGYPALQESFLKLGHLVTAPNPTDKTYYNKTYGYFWNKQTFVNISYGSTKLTGESYIYAPQYQWLNTQSQRDLYANEEQLWWYGCMHPVGPFPTYHINSPLISARTVGWMMYDYGIDGMVYSSVNYWGEYTENPDEPIVLKDFWNEIANSAAPGDQILVYPGSAYGLTGPIGSIRIENIREGNEDYEYLWMLENEFGISDISAYTANLYTDVIPNTDASIHYNNRKALLTKLEALSIEKYGATQDKTEDENASRGQAITAGKNLTIELGNTEAVVGLQFEYKLTDGNKLAVAVLSDWENYYGYYDLNADGVDAPGVYCQKLSDGYVRIIMELSALTKKIGTPTAVIENLYIRGDWSDANGFIDQVQVLTQMPDIEEEPTEPAETEPAETEPVETEPDASDVFAGGKLTSGSNSTIVLDNTQVVSKMTFDYKVESGTHFDLVLMPDWDNYYGYFRFDANGAADTYNGIATRKLSNGYIRVYVDMDALTAINGAPSKVLTIFFVRGTTSKVNGEITNIRINRAAEAAPRGVSLTPGIDQSISVAAKEALGSLSFEYKIESGEKLTVALMPDWNNYFGHFDFLPDGAKEYYDGVTTEALEDGYIRVTFEMDTLTKVSGDPSTVIDFLYLSGRYSTANGFLDNVQYVLKKDMPRGTELTPGVDQIISLGTKETVTSISFEYKITGGEKLTVALMSDWNNYFGNFDFLVNGAQENYAAVTTEALEDGFIRVTFDMAALTKLSGTPSYSVDFLYLSGKYTNASGYVDKIAYVEGCVHSYDAVVTAPTFTENGYTTHTCSVCGDSYATDEIPAYTAKVSGWNITLGDDIGANFYLELDSRIESATAIITVDGVVTYADLVKNEAGKFEVGVEVAAAQMTQDITLQVAYGQCVSDTMVYTVRQYADYILANTQDDNTKALVKAMLNYGAEAQNFFGYHTDKLANAGYELAETVDVPVVDDSQLLCGSVDGITFYGASVVFTSKVAVRFYFTVSGEISAYTFSAGSAPQLKDGMYYVEIAGINPQDYDAKLVLEVTDGTDTMVVQYSPLTYISRQVGKTENEGLKNLLMAMYRYHKAAETYLDEDEDVVKYRGEAVEAGVDKTIVLNNISTLSTLSLEYKILSGEYINVALMPNWDSYYGYFELNAEGSNGYDGVSYEMLADGYIRVTFDMAALNKTFGTPNAAIDFLYIRGAWSNAGGYIDNIRFS